MVGLGLGFVRGSGAAAAAPWYEGATTIPTSSGSATVTADPTAHTKGAWVEIVASNAAETSALGLLVSGVAQSATNTATLLDIGVGASGSETVIAGDIAIGGASVVYQVLPIRVASGTRIAARIQSVVTGGKTAVIAIDTFAAGDASNVPTSVDVLGTSTVTSEGTAVTTSYTEVVASTSQAYKAIGVIPSIANTSQANATAIVSVGVGASGSEVETHRKKTSLNSSEAVTTRVTNIFWITDVDIAAGSRLSAKTDVSGCHVTIIGVPA